MMPQPAVWEELMAISLVVGWSAVFLFAIDGAVRFVEWLADLWHSGKD